MSFEVQRRQCETCIYKIDWPGGVERLEAQIADKRMPGHFSGFRVCHHSGTACCNGFWSRHKDHFDRGQLAQRLGAVKFVDHDTLQASQGRKTKALFIACRLCSQGAHGATPKD